MAVNAIRLRTRHQDVAIGSDGQACWTAFTGRHGCYFGRPGRAVVAVNAIRLRTRYQDVAIGSDGHCVGVAFPGRRVNFRVPAGQPDGGRSWRMWLPKPSARHHEVGVIGSAFVHHPAADTESAVPGVRQQICLTGLAGDVAPSQQCERPEKQGFPLVGDFIFIPTGRKAGRQHYAKSARSGIRAHPQRRIGVSCPAGLS